jgi:hypothetical protein
MLERCCEIALDARGAPVSCQVRPDGVLPPGCCAERTGRSGDDGTAAVTCRPCDKPHK